MTRKPRRPTPVEAPTPIASAIDGAEAKKQAAAAAVQEGQHIKITVEVVMPLIQLQPGGRANIHVPADAPEGPKLMIWHNAEQAWTGLILAPGTEWVLLPAEQAPAQRPALWVPGQPGQA